MARATPRIRSAARPVASATAVVAALVVCAGCTVCPDPFDYSGPVPNGSPPQNDFRARSGGILPLNAAPKPWPPVVRDDATLPETAPAIADPEPQLADEPDPAMLQQTGAIVSDADGLDDDGRGERGSEAAVEPPAAIPTLSPVPSVPATGDQSGAGTADADVPAPGAGPVPVGPPAETPGWRPRRRAAG